jgi:hypothetical protein
MQGIIKVITNASTKTTQSNRAQNKNRILTTMTQHRRSDNQTYLSKAKTLMTNQGIKKTLKISN